MRDKRLISRYYDAIALSYEELYGEEQRAKLSQLLKLLPKRSFRAVLDAGCGVGLFFEKLSEISGEVVGLDLSQRMLELAHTRADKFKVHLVRGDVEHLPFRSGCFDLVVSATVLPIGASSSQALSEFRRVLGTGGLMALTVPRRADIAQRIVSDLKQLDVRIRAFHETPYIKDAVIIAEG